MLFSGQGKVFMAVRDANGSPGPFRFAGNVSALSVAMATEIAEHRESVSGQRLVDNRLTTSKSANASLTLDEFNADNLGLALFGQKATISADSITDEQFPADLEAGDFVRLAQQNISTLTIVDSDAGPTTLVEDTHYRIESPAHGSIEILDTDTLVQPFLADYDYDGGVNVAMFSEPSPIRWLRFEGLNTAESNSPVLVELYRVQFDPVADLGLITDEFGVLTLAGSALYDASKEADTELGTFGRMILL